MLDPDLRAAHPATQSLLSESPAWHHAVRSERGHFERALTNHYSIADDDTFVFPHNLHAHLSTLELEIRRWEQVA